MSIETSLQRVTQFWQSNQALIEEIHSTGTQAADQLAALAGKIDTSHTQAAELAASLGAQFQVSGDPATKATQQSLIGKIDAISQKIERFRDSPEITTNLLADRGTLYVALADTYDATVGQFVQFTPDEVSAINGLLQQAALDAASRQRWADILNSAVQLSELALKVAVKIAAA